MNLTRVEPVESSLHFFAGIEEESGVHGRLGDRPGQVEEDSQSTLHVHRPQSREGVAVETVTPLTEGRHGVEVTGEEESSGPAQSGPGQNRVAETVDG